MDRYILAVQIREEMWEGAVVNQFEERFCHFSGGSEENYEKSQDSR
jgi:hypothetical protein